MVPQMSEEIKKGYIRISSIMAQWESYPESAKANVQRKAVIGSKVHEIIEMTENGVYCDIPEDCSPYLESYYKYLSTRKLSPEQMETRYYDDKHMITGKIDAVVDGIIIDYKTSSKEDILKWQLQATFYSYLFGGEKREALFVHLLKDGSYKLYDFKNLDAQFPVMEAAITTYKYFN